MDPVSRYVDLVKELLFARHVNGGSLPDEKEIEFCEELDRRWWAMSRDEQGKAEHIIEKYCAADAIDRSISPT